MRKRSTRRWLQLHPPEDGKARPPGGAIQGRQIYGAMPSLRLDGPDDSSYTGLIIPRQSVDQYAATLARWFGLGESELRLVFPNLDRFERPSLGFMA